MASSLGGVGYLVFGQSTSAVTDALELPAAVALTESVSDGVQAPAQVLDEEAGRAAIKESLRAAVVERLALAPEPQSVPESTPSFAATEASLPPETAPSGSRQRTILWCDATVLESMFAAAWPPVAAVRQSEGVTVVTTPAPVAASGTVASSITLMQFPPRPIRLSEPACLQHAYVGVTLEGRLIHTNDTILYASRSEEELIGYAFDGHPIYGTSEAELDECGGIATATGYRYHLSPDDDFILGCFVSEPQQLLLRG